MGKTCSNISRCWDACTLENYSGVAGGENFREKRANRLKLWYTHKLQAYIFGDGSGNGIRFALDDRVPTASAANHEVSPWYTIDWIGWKLISWDMAHDGTGSWIGDGVLDGTLRLESIQMTHFPGAVDTGTVYIDDIHLIKLQPVNVSESPVVLVTKSDLMQNYPNPFNPTTTIQYSVSAGMHDVKLVVYDMLGKQVKTLVNQTQAAGKYQIEWDGTDSNGNKVASGLYLYRLVAGDTKISRYMTRSIFRAVRRSS